MSPFASRSGTCNIEKMPRRSAGMTKAAQGSHRGESYQHPPTGHQLRPVRVQQPSTNSLARRVLVYNSIYNVFGFVCRRSRTGGYVYIAPGSNSGKAKPGDDLQPYGDGLDFMSLLSTSCAQQYHYILSLCFSASTHPQGIRILLHAFGHEGEASESITIETHEAKGCTCVHPFKKKNITELDHLNRIE